MCFRIIIQYKFKVTRFVNCFIKTVLTKQTSNIFRRCNQVLPNHYLPTLHQFQKEIEDGYRRDGSPVRIGYKDEEFPGYSWRGYGSYSRLQDEVNMIKLSMR